MKKTCLFFIALLINAILIAQTASVTWPLKLPNAANSTISGNLTSATSVIGSNLTMTAYSGYSVATAPSNFFPNAPTDTYHLEYGISPSANNTFTFSELKFEAAIASISGINAFYIKVQYSVNGSTFTDLPGLSSVKIDAAFVLYKTTTGTSISVPKNGNIKFRIYPYYLGGNDQRTLALRDLVVTGTTTPVAGVPIENYGAKGFYTGNKFYNNLQVTPLPAEGKSLLTYTGSDDPFSASWVADSVEFLGFRNHLNPVTFPANGIQNGNYWPGTVTCRYSKVTDYINGKNVKVNFVYNGGSLPAATHTASGYFFINDRQALASAFSNTNSDSVFVFDTSKTYVSKGGWNTEPEKNIKIISNGESARSRIKVSIEDAFVEFERAIKGAGNNTNNSYIQTFNSPNFFVFTKNNVLDVELKNIDLLPPHYLIPGAEPGVGMSAIFAHTDTRNYTDVAQLGNIYSAGKRSIVNCNTTLEKAQLIQPSIQPSYVFSGFAGSNGGGKMDSTNTDIQLYQEFIMDNVVLESATGHFIRSTSRGGNFLRVLNSNLITSDAPYKGLWPNIQIKFSKDADYNNHVRKITILSNSPSTYQLAGQFWLGSQGHLPYSLAQARRGQYITVKDSLNQSWRIAISNAGSFAEEYNNLTIGNFAVLTNPLLDGNTLRIHEQIPVASYPGYTQTILPVDGSDSKNRKIDNYTFEFENIGLQALVTYPYVLNVEAYSSAYNPASQLISPDCDELEYTDSSNVVHTVRIVKRFRYIRSSVAPVVSTFPYNEMRKGYWRFEFDQPVTMPNPVFRVKKSVTQFVLDTLGVQADLRIFISDNLGTAEDINRYFTYSSKNLNTQIINSTTSGYVRATNASGLGDISASSPLWMLPKVKEFINSTHTGGHEYFGGKGLHFRNLKENVDIYCMKFENNTGYGNPPTAYGEDPICEDEVEMLQLVPMEVTANKFQEAQNVENISVYPNPAKNSATVTFTSKTKGSGFVVVNNSIGVEVSRIPVMINEGTQKISLNTSNYSTGFYNVSIISGTKIANVKLVINK